MRAPRRIRAIWRRLLAGAVLALSLVVPAAGAFAHASLIGSDPPDGAVLASAPTALRLDFNEPVMPLVMRVIGPDGVAVTPTVKAENTSVTLTPPALKRGTNVLSWRVISADGHPVGGAVVFSIGAASQGVAAESLETDRSVDAAIWIVRLTIYLGLFVGVGGAAFVALIGQARPLPGRVETWIAGALVAGLAASLLSLGLQGLDALAQPLTQILQPAIWREGLATSYGTTAIIDAVAMLLGLVALRASARLLARLCAVAGLIGVGAALAASGHASTAAPELVSRPVVLVHGMCVAFWVGSLLPLVAIVRDPQRGALQRHDGELRAFSRWIPLPLAVLIATGVYLVWVQLDRPDALWSTRYGEVLSVKLVAVLVLLALGAANRFWLVPRLEAKQADARRPLVRSIGIESALACAILATVALWRFTPPPRSLIGGEASSIHFHGGTAMAQIDVAPVRARGAEVSIEVLDGNFRPLVAKEVTIAIANATAGIEPVRRAATHVDGPDWRIDDLRIPVGGVWSLEVDILIDDFDKVALEDKVILPRSP